MSIVIGLLLLGAAALLIAPVFFMLGVNHGLSEWIAVVPKITYWQSFFVTILLLPFFVRAAKNNND